MIFLKFIVFSDFVLKLDTTGTSTKNFQILNSCKRIFFLLLIGIAIDDFFENINVVVGFKN